MNWIKYAVCVLKMSLINHVMLVSREETKLVINKKIFIFISRLHMIVCRVLRWNMYVRKIVWILLILLKMCTTIADASNCCNKRMLKSVHDRFLTSLTRDYEQRFSVSLQRGLDLNCSAAVLLNDLVRCELKKLEIDW